MKKKYTRESLKIVKCLTAHEIKILEHREIDPDLKIIEVSDAKTTTSVYQLQH